MRDRSRSHRLESDGPVTPSQVVALLAPGLMLGSALLLGGVSSWLLQPGLTAGSPLQLFRVTLYSVAVSLGEPTQGRCTRGGGRSGKLMHPLE